MGLVVLNKFNVIISEGGICRYWLRKLWFKFDFFLVNEWMVMLFLEIRF